ncbi:MAG TPA: transcription antitermination factor NusB [Pedococcus sp.]|nr:transcription antitermination factor NusB [Pedococcus sp.]
MADPRRPARAGQPRPGRGRTSKVDAARLVAYDVLVAVREQDAYTNLLLASMLRERQVSGRDAAFATELVSGTIRRQGTYDAVIAACVNRPLSKVDAGVLDALRLGTHQILAMRVPTHAAVSTTVELVRQRVGHGPAGFVNAVLRKVAAHDLAGWVRRVAPDPDSDPVGFASVAYSHPRWVVEALQEALGGTVELERLLAADNAAPKVTLVARPGLASVEELVEAGGSASAQSPYAVELASGDPSGVPAVAQGRAGVQDEGSQLVALALSRAEVDGRDERWLDMCAGPGGKSALLAAIAAERGALVLASERQVHRAGLVKRATAAAGAGLAGVIAADGTVPAWAPGSFDRVLVDAPCSGLGALRRRPESRWRRTPSDIDDLVPLQERLLRSALDAVRPGGVVAYVTCSPVVPETSEVVSRVLADRPDVVLQDAVPLFAGVPELHAEAVRLRGTVQLWPHRQGTDAMFFALLRKRPEG